MTLGLADIREAADRIRGRVLRTPTIGSAALSERCDADILLKLDNLQVVGSFKERGAANRLALLGAGERSRGVVAMSAGNHAQGVARHANLLGIDAVIVMPEATPAAKITRTAAWGARVVLHGETLADATAHAHELADADGRVFIHPFDDPAIIAGQGTMALEILEDAGPVDILVLPIGGGGLIAGCAIAAAALCPAATVVGVQVDSHASLGDGPSGADRAITGGATVAEGIAVARVGDWPRPISHSWSCIFGSFGGRWWRSRSSCQASRTKRRAGSSPASK